MIVLHLEALAGIALSLSILMAIAWAVQQRTGNSGLAGTGSALWPIMFFPLPPHKGVVT
jgi:steroid 5-alpha reductase family enzyme